MAAEDQGSGEAAMRKNAQQIENDFNQNKDAVMKMLLQNVINVNIEIPRVIKGDFETYLE